MQGFSVNQTSSIWGDYREDLADSQEYLTILFSPGSASLQQRWRKNALSANFLADYFATCFPTAADSDSPRIAELQDQVNFIANELLENAMKFCDRTVNIPIRMTLRLFPDSLVFEVSNALTAETADQFQIFIQGLLADDPSVLLLRQLEHNAVDSQSHSSRLGFLTLMSDYQAKIGWKFEPLPQIQDAYTVTIRACLKLQPC